MDLRLFDERETAAPFDGSDHHGDELRDVAGAALVGCSGAVTGDAESFDDGSDAMTMCVSNVYVVDKSASLRALATISGQPFRRPKWRQVRDTKPLESPTRALLTWLQDTLSFPLPSPGPRTRRSGDARRPERV
jgi:hypothetical protein